jgi:hypothetical protein
MPTVSFDDYIREIEAHATPAEHKLLEVARNRAAQCFEQVVYAIRSRERAEWFRDKFIAEYGEDNVTVLKWGNEGPLDHDGPCIEVCLTATLRFTTLPFKAEVWGERGTERITHEPFIVDGHSDEEVLANSIAYINKDEHR